MTVGFKCRLKDWSRFPEPVPAASGIMVQPFRTATACDGVDTPRRHQCAKVRLLIIT
jgi:hypothetical protein